jgi:hypothetical protein
MNSLLMAVELILAIFLERTTRKNAPHSSKPLSQMENAELVLGHVGCHCKGK